MIRRISSSAEVSVIGAEASQILSEISGISDVRVENQSIDRATLSFDWDTRRSNFDFRPDFDTIDQKLQAKGIHRMLQ
jgi:hypothetical protein